MARPLNVECSMENRPLRRQCAVVTDLGLIVKWTLSVSKVNIYGLEWQSRCLLLLNLRLNLAPLVTLVGTWFVKTV